MVLDSSIIAALFGGFSGAAITGVISIIAIKLTANDRARIRREKLERGTAQKRLDSLYEPLLNFMRAGISYDGLDFDEKSCQHIIQLIEKNKRCASADLLGVYCKLEVVFHQDFPEISRGLDALLYNTVSAEYDTLKDILGYGPILKKQSKSSRLFSNIRSTIVTKGKNFRRKYRTWRIVRGRRA